MSYYEQAEKINEKLKKAFDKIENEEVKKTLIEGFLYFGQVAKFRCRQNTAYDNFASLTLKDIAEVKRKDLEGFDFATLQVENII